MVFIHKIGVRFSVAVQKIKVLQSSWSGRRPVTAEIAGSSPARTAKTYATWSKAEWYDLVHYEVQIESQIISFKKLYCGVEQLVARWAHNPEVAGSSPAPATNEFFEIIMLNNQIW